MRVIALVMLVRSALCFPILFVLVVAVIAGEVPHCHGHSSSRINCFFEYRLFLDATNYSPMASLYKMDSIHEATLQRAVAHQVRHASDLRLHVG